MPKCEHGCCQYPWLRIEDGYGGRAAPSRGQCGCECHEAGASCPVHGQRAGDRIVRERMARQGAP